MLCPTFNALGLFKYHNIYKMWRVPRQMKTNVLRVWLVNISKEYVTLSANIRFFDNGFFRKAFIFLQTRN